MRCIICGRETNEGVWTKDGFVCSICRDALDFQPCFSCGLFFKVSDMQLIDGDFYCKECIRAVPKIAKPKKPARAGGRILTRVPEEEILASSVEKRTLEILNRKRSLLATFFGFLGNLIRGKKRDYSIKK